MDINKEILENIKKNFEQCQQSGNAEMLVYCNDSMPYAFSAVGVPNEYSPWYAHDYLKIDDPHKHHTLLMAFDMTKTFEEQYDHRKTQYLNDPEIFALDPLICIPDRNGTKPNGRYNLLTEEFEKAQLKVAVSNKHIPVKNPAEQEQKQKRPRPDYLRPVK